MTTHIMALTYAPKIEGVKAGTIRQTMRLINVGDTIPAGLKVKHISDELLFHTWAGRPYRSKWDWRELFKVKEVLHLFYTHDTWRWWPDMPDALAPIGRQAMEEIATLDGIVPPTLEELEKVQMKLNGLKSLNNTDWEVTRW